MIGHAYVFEWIQLAAAILGACFNTYALSDAMKNARKLREYGVNGTRKVVAEGAVQQELLRLLVQLLLVVQGISSCVLPPPDPPLPDLFLWNGYITRSIALMMTFLLALKSILDVRDRKSLLRLWLKEVDRRQHTEQIEFPDRRHHQERREELTERRGHAE